MKVIVPINITSTSKTALVSVSGLSSGVQVKYSASDTSPSGSLAFTVNAWAPHGTYAVSDGELGLGNRLQQFHTGHHGSLPDGKHSRARKICHAPKAVAE